MSTITKRDWSTCQCLGIVKIRASGRACRAQVGLRVARLDVAGLQSLLFVKFGASSGAPFFWGATVPCGPRGRRAAH
jgi:hypothetical protein